MSWTKRTGGKRPLPSERNHDINQEIIGNDDCGSLLRLYDCITQQTHIPSEEQDEIRTALFGADENIISTISSMTVKQLRTGLDAAIAVVQKGSFFSVDENQIRANVGNLAYDIRKVEGFAGAKTTSEAKTLMLDELMEFKDCLNHHSASGQIGIG